MIFIKIFSDVINYLQGIDNYILSLINKFYADPVLDQIFIFSTNMHHNSVVKYIVFPIFCIWFLWRYRIKGLVFIPFFVLAVFGTDWINAHWIKPFFHRPRPGGPGVVIRTYASGSYGFASGHTANCFAAAFMLSAFFLEYRWLFFTYAVFIGYSRIYVGVHYPSDVLGGAVLGGLIGYLISNAYVAFASRKSF